MTQDERTAAAVALLGDKRSARRRLGAKRLRQQPDPTAGPALLAALRLEVRDPRTWETQYHRIMALAACGYTPALPVLEELTRLPFEARRAMLASAMPSSGPPQPPSPKPLPSLDPIPTATAIPFTAPFGP